MNPPEGWSPEQWAALSREEQLGIRFGFGNYAYRPEDPRIPARQRGIHDLFAGKRHDEIRAMLTHYIGPEVNEAVRKANLRRLRRAAGVAVTAVTAFDTIVSRVEEWAHKLLGSGQMLEDLITRVRQTVEDYGILWDGQETHVGIEHPLHEVLSEIVYHNEHLGINAMERAAIAAYPNSLGKEMLEGMRAKISEAGKNGGAHLPAPAMVLGQYESYFHPTQLRQLAPDTLQQLSRSLGLTNISPNAIHNAARKRFLEIRGQHKNSCRPTPTLKSSRSAWRVVAADNPWNDL